MAGASLLVATFCSCAEDHIFVPTEHVSAEMAESGLPAALYELPPHRPQGEVKVAAIGSRKIRGTDERELVLRMVVTNNSDAAWRVDLREQRLLFANGNIAQPDLVYANGVTAQMLVVAPRQQGAADLVYAIPPDGALTSFQLAWSVSTPTEYITRRTTFRQKVLEPEYAYLAYEPYGYAPYYYYNPAFGFAPPFGFTTIVIRERPLYPGPLHVGPRIHARRLERDRARRSARAPIYRR